MNFPQHDPFNIHSQGHRQSNGHTSEQIPGVSAGGWAVSADASPGALGFHMRVNGI